MNEKNMKIRRLTTIAVLTALSFIIVAFVRIPITTVEFLKYEPKDVVITVAGFVFGAPAAIAISVTVSFIEMVTLSSTGLWGFLMNVLSTCAFAGTASFIYRRKKNASSAVIGLFCGMILSVGVMILWNWLVTPFYMGMPRETVAEMLIPVFLPFNLLKCGLNTALTLVIYKPAFAALIRAQLVSERQLTGGDTPRVSAAIMAFGSLATVSLVLVVLIITGVI